MEGKTEEYEIATIPIDSAQFTRSGVVMPLCNTCINEMCPHDIEWKEFSVLGKTEMHRLHKLFHNTYDMVIDCNGYINKESEDMQNSLEELMELE